MEKMFLWSIINYLFQNLLNGFTQWSYICIHDGLLRAMLYVDRVPVSWSWLRVPGVLQRLGFTYFVLSLLQTFLGQTETPQAAVSSSARFHLSSSLHSREEVQHEG